MARLLLVCLGNICRSPLAEGVLRHQAQTAGVPIEVESAGTGAWHIGKPPDPRAIAVAARRGYDIANLRARQVAPADFERFDLILAMDGENHAVLEALRPLGNATLVARFLAHASGREADVPDPYFDGGFELVLDLIEDAARDLVGQLQ